MSSPSIEDQLNLMSQIEKAYKTFKKSPRKRLDNESYLLTRIELLEDKWNVIAENHKKLLESENIEETSYIKDDVFPDMEIKYIRYRSEMRDLLVKLSRDPPQTQSSSSEPCAKLPRFTIPVFSGSSTEWADFKGLYESLIHNNPSVDDLQKMHYLKSHLSEEAEWLLMDLPITAANYAEAWLTLTSKYDK